ncbi:MAG: 2-keto-4-pentenoate hydratase, partial [Candidatus Nanopelagicales bacterium]
LTGSLDSLTDLRNAITGACVALEIVDSRIANWQITITDTIADNASSGMFVYSDRLVPLSEVEPRDVTMSMTVNGELKSSGNGAACLGDPLAALLWLAQKAQELGDPIRAGEVVLSGALGPMAVVQSGDVVKADVTGLGTVEVRFA